MIDRLEEVPVGEVMGRERREESLDMVDLGEGGREGGREGRREG